MSASRCAVVTCAWLALLLPFQTASAAGDVWALLQQPGHVVLLRHAKAPGGGNVPPVGDPKNFRLDDCATQRNLSEAGRAQARALGAALQQHGVSFPRVLSSQWCRCLETARLAGTGEPEPFPALNNFFDDRARAPAQIAELKAFLAGVGSGERLLLVTHGVVISGLTGQSVAEGEMLILKLDGTGSFAVAGRIPPP